MFVVLVEDDPYIAQSILAALDYLNVSVEHVDTAKAADYFIRNSAVDLCLLDLGLPDQDGLDLLNTWRKDQIHVPVLVLTARNQTQQCVDALNTGADDYLTKPFELAELEARLAALHRRSQGRAQPQVECGSLRYDGNHGTFWLADAVLNLTPREHAALEGLVARIGAPVGKARLAAKVFPQESAVGPDAIEQVLHRLRRKLAGSDVHIVTVRGLGYMLEAQDEPPRR